MHDIKHQITISGIQRDVYAALTTIDGLAAWWTRTTTGSPEVGGSIDFRFGEHVSTMRVDEANPEQRVVWQCTASAPDWVGTRVHFDLKPSGDDTILTFGHCDWKEANDFFGHCSMKWATFLLSLKQYVESGEGKPFPNDLAI